MVIVTTAAGMTYPNPWQRQPVGILQQMQALREMILAAITAAAFRGFRAAYVTAMVISTTLVSMLNGGHPQRAQ